MKSLVALLIVVTSTNVFALEKEAIKGKAALQIVAALERVGVEGMPEGSDDAGNIDIKSYSYYGMKCYTAWSDYGGYGSKEVGSCDFKGVASQKNLEKIRTRLSEVGLKKTNPLFK